MKTSLRTSLVLCAGVCFACSSSPPVVDSVSQTTLCANIQALSSIIASNQLFALGGADDAGAVQRIAKSNTYTAPPIFGPTLNTNSAAATDVGQTQTIAAYSGLVFTSAHFYLLGGTTNGTDAIARVWSNVYSAQRFARGLEVRRVAPTRSEVLDAWGY